MVKPTPFIICLQPILINIKSFFENGQIKSFRYNHNKISITELYHKDDSIYCIKAYNTGNMELYFDQDNIEITQMNLVPDFMKDTELQIREKYNLKKITL